MIQTFINNIPKIYFWWHWKTFIFCWNQSDLTCRIIGFLIAPDFHDKVILSVNFFQYSMVFVLAVLFSNLMNKMDQFAFLLWQDRRSQSSHMYLIQKQPTGMARCPLFNWSEMTNSSDLTTALHWELRNSK